MRKLLPISSVAKSMVEPLRREKETASTRMLEGLIVGWVKWLRGERINQLVEWARKSRKKSRKRRALTNRRLLDVSLTPFYIGTHDIHQIRRLFVMQHRGSFLCMRFVVVAIRRRLLVRYVRKSNGGTYLCGTISHLDSDILLRYKIYIYFLVFEMFRRGGEQHYSRVCSGMLRMSQSRPRRLA